MTNQVTPNRPLKELTLYDVSKSQPQHHALPWERH